MINADEADGLNQLGTNLSPSNEAGFNNWTDGFGQLGNRAIHAVFGETSFPEMKDALNVMYGNSNGPTDIGSPALRSQGFPNLEINAEPTISQSFPSAPGFEPATLTGSGRTISTDSISPVTDSVGKALNQVVSDLFKNLLTGPLGILGAVLGFLITMFSEFISAASQAITEFARAAASFANEIWKKQLEASTS